MENIISLSYIKLHGAEAVMPMIKKLLEMGDDVTIINLKRLPFGLQGFEIEEVFSDGAEEL